jgi:hypothetical protein
VSDNHIGAANASVAFTGDADIVRTGPTGSEVIGKVVIGISADRMRAEGRQRLLLVTSLAAVLLVCVIASTLSAYRRIVGRPLDRLLQGIKSSEYEIDAVPVDWRSNDEMGELIAAFNEMLSDRIAYEADLRAARDELEARVDLRTRELAAASQQLVEAIESTSEGFSLFDKDDRLIISNTNYQRMLHPNGAGADRSDLFAPGTPFVDILRHAVKAGITTAPTGSEEEWIAEQVSMRRSPEGRRTQQRSMASGSASANGALTMARSSAVYSNVSELEDARQDAEAANEAKSTFLATRATRSNADERRLGM